MEGSGRTGLSEGVVDYADGGDLVDGEAERDGDVGVAVDEVRCAVYGVEYDCRYEWKGCCRVRDAVHVGASVSLSPGLNVSSPMNDISGYLS